MDKKVLPKKPNKNIKNYPSMKYYNINCKRTFYNEKGLSCHLDKSNKCMTALKQLKFMKKQLSFSVSSELFADNINNEDNTESVNVQETYETKKLQKFVLLTQYIIKTNLQKFWRMQMWQIMCINKSLNGQLMHKMQN